MRRILKLELEQTNKACAMF